ncbi:protein TTE1956-like isoform X2 [Halichondria panicea]|uniref:protein TTE1956-like isoform X2 n=1 Tax=Halichondria panicea TaxID=6063 RepID=UPI00312BB478
MKTDVAILFVIVFFLKQGLVRPEIIGAVVLPHGGIALDPSHFKTTNKTSLAQAWEIHNACMKAGKLIEGLKPDLILLSTPHGVADQTNFQFYLNSKGFGSTDTDNCACPPCCYNVSVDLDQNVSKDLVIELKAMSRNVSGLVGFGDAVPFPLAWGEVIPLHFLLGGARVVVLSQPNRRYTDSVQMIPELLEMGTSLFSVLESSNLKVVVAISADLAHTHDHNGPYGYSNASQPFDDALGKWAESLDSQALLHTAASLVDRALSCGFTGLVMLHGLMESIFVGKTRMTA